MREMPHIVDNISYKVALKDDLRAMYLRDEMEAWFTEQGLGLHFDWRYSYDSHNKAVRFHFHDAKSACLFKLVWA